MTALALFLSGWLTGVLTVVFLAIIGLRASGDRLEQPGDNAAEPTFAGGGADRVHDQPDTQSERAEHA